jgi:DNA-binding MarR family transcriptional regulator
VSDAIRRLESRGRVVREANPADGRSVLFALTADGGAQWRRGWPALQRVNTLLGAELEDPELLRGALEELGSAAATVLAKNTIS